MNGTSVSNGTRLSTISISQRSFGNFPESFGKWKTPWNAVVCARKSKVKVPVSMQDDAAVKRRSLSL